ncbi:GDSL-type esterase/lipase family protein [Pendulispora albinea]|uniref:GDSL-type esterase/lipase family protein n=1 Tax=Pendulispora albinea TaxID=2741071 RepID=A0ABZ2M1D7_9BACT
MGGKTARALAVMALVLAIPYLSPKLRSLRVAALPWEPPPPEVTTAENGAPDEKAANAPAPANTVGETTLRATENQGTVTNALPSEKTEAPVPDPAALAKLAGSIAVEDPTGRALDAFYAQLARTERKERPGGSAAITRVLHYGDSVITSDLISGTMRRRFQDRFGDAGHGFVLTANPWEWYFHNDVVHAASEGWNISRITGPFSGDHIYGLGGVSFHTAGAATATFGTPAKGDYGRKVSRFDVYYLEQPGGGDIDLAVAGSETETFSTRGASKASRVYTKQVPDGAATLTLRTRGNGDARVFGVALERDEPGVVYDALGANGARARLWDQMDGAHWADQMALRKPALIILQYGTNESEDGGIQVDAYVQKLGALIDKVKTGAPGASVMVASPLDRAEKTESGGFRTRKIIVQLVDLQRKTALEHQVAFFNTYEAMGGSGAMGRWVHANPQLGSWDLTHPTPAGGEMVGNLMFKALMAGYTAYSAREKNRN